MSKITQKGFILLAMVVVLVLTLFVPEVASAQCQACKSTVETNLASGGTAGLGLNRGILYLLSMPYIMALSIGAVWYFKYRNKKQSSHGQAA